ncbi:UNVERIFIED_CONTAM: hypothetical protein Sindi_1270800 [Sesamum indicum]
MKGRTAMSLRLNGALMLAMLEIIMAYAIVQDDGLANAMTTFCESVNEQLGELNKKSLVDFDEVEKRSAVYEAVGKVFRIDLD